MKTIKSYHVILSVVSVLSLCMLIAAPVALADYMQVDYTNMSGEPESALLARFNGNGYAVGWAGGAFFEEMMNFGFKRRLPALTGLICTDVTAPSASIISFFPSEAEVNGVVYSLENRDGEALPYFPGGNGELRDYVFLPSDINDNNTVVGSFIYTTTDGNVSALPFLAEEPWTTPIIICGVTADGEIGQLFASDADCLIGSSQATGINNSGDIVGVMSGIFISDDYLSLAKGFSFNKAAVAGDGLVSSDELSIISCGRSFMTYPLAINNFGDITGAAFSFEYPLDEGSYILGLDGNFVLSEDGMPIGAGWNDCAKIAENILEAKYVEFTGFVKSIYSSDDDFILVDRVKDWSVEQDQQPDVTEVYGTIPYDILDSRQVLLSKTNIDPKDGSENELFTLNEMFAVLLNPNQPALQLNFSSLAQKKSGLMGYDPLSQEDAFSAVEESGRNSIRKSVASVDRVHEKRHLPRHGRDQ